MNRQNDFSGKVVLITGGAVRIGRAIGEAFARAGARVAIHCRNSVEAAAGLVDRLQAAGGEAFWLSADLSDGKQRAAIIPQVIERAGRLDCLVNNASVYRRAWLADLDESDFLADWRINFEAPFQLMRQFAVMVGEGSVINLLDQRVAGVDPGAGAYGLAKKMLRDATEAAALEWAPRIRVNGVAPGLSLPPPGVAAAKMQALLPQVPLRRASAPGEVAAACLYLTAARSVTGQVLYVDGGLHLGGSGLIEKPPGTAFA